MAMVLFPFEAKLEAVAAKSLRPRKSDPYDGERQWFTEAEIDRLMANSVQPSGQNGELSVQPTILDGKDVFLRLIHGRQGSCVEM